MLGGDRKALPVHIHKLGIRALCSNIAHVLRSFIPGSEGGQPYLEPSGEVPRAFVTATNHTKARAPTLS